jgi:hypothetical protein
MELTTKTVPTGEVAAAAVVQEPTMARMPVKMLMAILLEEGNLEAAVETVTSSAAMEAMGISDTSSTRTKCVDIAGVLVHAVHKEALPRQWSRASCSAWLAIGGMLASTMM